MYMKRIALLLAALALLLCSCSNPGSDEPQKNQKSKILYSDEAITVTLAEQSDEGSLPITIYNTGIHELVLSSRLCIKILSDDGEDLTSESADAMSLNTVLKPGSSVSGTVSYDPPADDAKKVVMRIAVDYCRDEWIEFDVTF